MLLHQYTVADLSTGSFNVKFEIPTFLCGLAAVFLLVIILACSRGLCHGASGLVCLNGKREARLELTSGLVDGLGARASMRVRPDVAGSERRVV